MTYTFYENADKTDPVVGTIVTFTPPKDDYDVAATNRLNIFEASQLRSKQYWLNPLGPGSDDFGFDALPAGWYNGTTERFENLYGFAGWWASDDVPGTASANAFIIAYYCNQIQGDVKKKIDGLSVRCVMDY